MNRLPPELLIQVLSELPFSVILRTRQVCRYWQKLIQSSVVLEYQIELEVHRKVDNPQSTLSVADRLKILRRHAEAWRDLSWSRRDVFNLGDLFPRLEAISPYYLPIMTPVQEWQGGSAIRVSLHGFPSTLAPTSSRPSLCRAAITLQTRFFIMDAERDIIIFQESDRLVNQSPWRSIRLHSLSTVAESLTEPRVLYRYLRAGLSGIVEDILDDFILISLTDYQQTIIALVVQWTTGWIASRVVLPYRDIDNLYPAMAFVSPLHFLITIGRGTNSIAGPNVPPCSRIAVYEFRPPQCRLDDENVPTPVQVASYLLPDSQSAERGDGNEFSIKSHPPTMSKVRRWSPKAFTDSADDWIFSIHYASHISVVELEEEDIDEDYPPYHTVHIVTHASTLLRYTSSTSPSPSSQPIEVPWDDWGLEGTRCFPGSTEDEILEPRIYGERCAILTEHPYTYRLCVYDFNQARVRRARQASTSASAPGWPPLRAGPRMIHSLEESAPLGDTVGCPAFDGGRITGRLPYMATIIDVFLKRLRTYDLDEEHLIFLTNIGSDPNKGEPSLENLQLEVYTM